MGINFVIFDMLFLALKVPVAVDLHFMNHQGAWFHLKIIFIVLLKKKSHLDLGRPEGE